MHEEVDLDSAYSPSPDIVAREIEGEIIIVPLVSGVGDMEDELYTLNETGRAVWDRLDGSRSLRQVARELEDQYDPPEGGFEPEVAGLVGELLSRRLVVRRT